MADRRCVRKNGGRDCCRQKERKCQAAYGKAGRQGVVDRTKEEVQSSRCERAAARCGARNKGASTKKQVERSRGRGWYRGKRAKVPSSKWKDAAANCLNHGGGRSGGKVLELNGRVVIITCRKQINRSTHLAPPRIN